MVADCQKVMRVRAELNKSPDFLGSNFFNIRMTAKAFGALTVNINLKLNCCAEMGIIVGLDLFGCWFGYFFNC